MISAPSIARLKDSIPLQAFIGEYVQLKSFKGLCPFHTERTPSFVVHPEYWKCFGCGLAGDAITFYSKIEGVSPSEAIKQLAERYGVSLDVQRQTRVQRIHNRELSEFAEWWYKRIIHATELRLTAHVIHDTEEAESIGLFLRELKSVKRLEVPAMAERCATAEEWAEWRTWRVDQREFEKAWTTQAVAFASAILPLVTEALRI